MDASLVVVDARIWNAEAEYALSVAGAEASMGASSRAGGGRGRRFQRGGAHVIIPNGAVCLGLAEERRAVLVSGRLE